MPTANRLTRQTVVSFREGNIVSNMGEEKVMLSVNNGKYYNLGEMGGEIWDMLQQPVTVAEIIDALLAEYGVEPSVCEAQVLAFLEQLHGEALIQVLPSA